MESNTDDLSTTLYGTVTADGPDGIRLIHLLPGALTDELRCTLVGADLPPDANSSSPPPYEALSYVWGPPVFDAMIVCNEDIHFKITSNLHRSLVRLRALDQPRVLWVDQICINQASKPDRAAQLQTTLIEFIQTLASARRQQHRDGLTVSDGNDVRSALQLSQMDAAQRKRYGLPGWQDARWKMLLYIYAAFWMRRTWIVQEVALPRKVDVMIGPVLMDWQGFSSVLFYVESLKVFGMDFGSLSSWKAFLALGARRARTQNGEFSPLSEVLFEHRRGKATDARDRVFGLMGLAAEREKMSLVADYEASVMSVFTDVTVDMLRRSGNLDILGLVGPVRTDRPEGLPSWVPDYGSPQGPHPVTKRGTIYTTKNPQVSTIFAASGRLQPFFSIDERHALVLPAVIIGEIGELAGCCVGQQDDDVDVQHGLGQVGVAYGFQQLPDQIETRNTSLSWGNLTHKIMETSPAYYEATGESTRDALLMTAFEGQGDKITDEIRALYGLEGFSLAVWRILTLGRGCMWLPAAMPLALAQGFLVFISMPFWNMLGYPSVSTVNNYTEMTKDATDRRLFCTTTDGLVGLAPPGSVPGDNVALLQGGRAPVVLR
ncbi:Uu.00g055000.m01.CDS01 [Anthostomella pinea]|uniref:Uu.00g055000.m01.CDS01 n=1 Tax=Anthostomella pinea TaxID=933095 RepID=A0AAI8YPQ6_9PEZI|nr:Uu.00g055000.m01.CDS01 [Anthostomella pinea]